MIKTIKSVSILLAVLIISCKNHNEETESINSEQKEIVIEDNTTVMDTIKFMDELQGTWEEKEYPFRRVEFVKSTVKFTEEGLVDAPKFETFQLTKNCQFDNNNIKEIKPDDLILSLPENKRCEKINIFNDTLTLSGFSGNANDEYKIVYLKKITSAILYIYII